MSAFGGVEGVGGGVLMVVLIRRDEMEKMRDGGGCEKKRVRV
jgi:hypothetical protein